MFHRKAYFSNTSKLTVILGLTLALALSVTAFAAAQKPKVTIGSKNFTESYLLGDIATELLRAHGYEVEHKAGLGGNSVIFPAIQRGDIDIYPEYAGTAYLVQLGREFEIPMRLDDILDTVVKEMDERFDLEFMPTLGFNNTYVFATTKEMAEKYNLEKVSDLIPIANRFSLGGSIDFMSDRPDGIRGVEDVYGMKFKRNRPMDSSLIFRALQLGQVDLIVAFATHGQIAAMDLVTLEDDRGVFPSYHASYVARNDLFEQEPEIRSILMKLHNALDEKTIAGLNYRVDGDHEEPSDVARDWLLQEGLISE